MHKTPYWIKLYNEILEDPKMGIIDDHTWRRTIELFLIAGKHNRAGTLPPGEVIAWILHTTQDEILSVLLALEQVGITSRDEAGDWRVTNFLKRQCAISSADRGRAFRQRRANRDEDETNRDAFVTDACQECAPDTDSDTDIDSDPEEVCDSHHTMSFEERTPGQTYFTRLYKTQPAPSELLSLAQLENIHGYYRLTQVIDWAVKSGIPPGRALRAIQTAITTWSDHPPPHPADRGGLNSALEQLRRKLAGEVDA